MIIVTGATGFIGSALVWELNQRGREDIVVVDVIRPDLRNGILSKRKYEKFLTHTELWDFLAQKPKVEAILHMGACSSTTELNRMYLRTINTEYTQRLFEWCTENQTRFIYASSGAVYGDGGQGFDDQTDPRFFSHSTPTVNPNSTLTSGPSNSPKLRHFGWDFAFLMCTVPTSITNKICPAWSLKPTDKFT